MFGIWIHAWLPSSPAKHNLYSFEKKAKNVFNNMPFARAKNYLEKD